MPFMPCTKSGKSGTKWGESGTCYTGPDAKGKATKQMQAIEASKRRRGMRTKKDIMEKKSKGYNMAYERKNGVIRKVQKDAIAPKGMKHPKGSI